MTGFGRAENTFSGKKIFAEIKTLNSKNLNLNIRIPELYGEKEFDIRTLVSDKLERGKINLTVTIETEEDSKVRLNETVINSYYKQLSRLAQAQGHNPNEELFFQTILRLPDTLKTDNTLLNNEEWQVLKDTIITALNKTDDYRIKEGNSISADLKQKIEAIKQGIVDIGTYDEERIEIVKERLNKKLEQINKTEESKDRFEQEIIYYLDKFDINEEIQRLEHHCAYFLETMETKSAGKKLNFISQEIGREINTTGSKANHHKIQKIVVEMKDNLEQIKEQLLNTL